MIYFGAIMFAGFILTSIVTGSLQAFLPEPLARQIGGGLFFAVIIGGIAFLEGFYILTTSSYPYIAMTIRPQNEIVNLFLSKDPRQERNLGYGWYSNMFNLKYPIKIESFGNTKINKIKLIHKFPWEQRIGFNRGEACKDDYDFTHPQTERIDVVQELKKEITMDQAEVIPEYKVISARNDYDIAKSLRATSPTNPNGVKAIDNPSVNTIEFNKLLKENSELKLQNAQEKSEKEYFHMGYISLRQVNEQQRVETRGLLGADSGVKEHAIEFSLDLFTKFGDLGAVVDYLTGGKFQRIYRWMIIGGLIALGIFYLWSNPRLLDNFGIWASDPQHQVTMIVVIFSLLLLFYWIMKRKR